MILLVEEQVGKMLFTNKGEFRIESLYTEDDIVMNNETGEIYFINNSETDENGNFSALNIE